MTAPLPPATWRVHRDRHGAPFAALFVVAGREYALVYPHPTPAAALFARLGLDPTAAPWRADPTGVLAALDAAQRATLEGELLSKSWVQAAPPDPRRVVLADRDDVLLGGNPLALVRWVSVCLDVFAMRAGAHLLPAIQE